MMALAGLVAVWTLVIALGCLVTYGVTVLFVDVVYVLRRRSVLHEEWLAAERRKAQTVGVVVQPTLRGNR